MKEILIGLLIITTFSANSQSKIISLGDKTNINELLPGDELIITVDTLYGHNGELGKLKKGASLILSQISLLSESAIVIPSCFISSSGWQRVPLKFLRKAKHNEEFKEGANLCYGRDVSINEQESAIFQDLVDSKRWSNLINTNEPMTGELATLMLCGTSCGPYKSLSIAKKAYQKMVLEDIYSPAKLYNAYKSGYVITKINVHYQETQNGWTYKMFSGEKSNFYLSNNQIQEIEELLQKDMIERTRNKAKEIRDIKELMN